jgi:signal transduction histidine kinase/ActR/RegA family two-component response regulator
VVRGNAEQKAQQHLEQDTRQAILTFQVVQQQQHLALSRKADLLAFLAFMRNGDATAIEDASNDPWQSEDFNLFVLADKSGKIKAIHSTASAFPVTAAQEMIWRSLSRGETSGWWSDGKNLYQVVLKPFYEDESKKKNLQGYVVVGRLINDQAARDLGKIASSDVVFQYGDQDSISTLPPLKEAELEKRIHDRLAITQLDLDGERYYSNAVDLTPGMNPGTNLIVLKSYNEVAAYLKRLNHLLLGLGLVTMFAGGALIFVISDTITRPVAALMQGVQALERGDFNYPLEAMGHDEVSKLTRAFESMRGSLRSNQAQREQLEAQLQQSQKMEALGRLAGGVAHDFNNLLTVIMGHSELLLDHHRPGDALHNHSEQIRKTAGMAASLTRQMLAFSRMQVVQPKVLDINNLVMETEKLLRRLIREDIEFSFRLGDSIGHVKVDAGQLEQALLNLTVNASDAMPLGGKLTIETQNVDFDKSNARTRPPIEPGKYILMSVTDTGHGMAADTKARIFEPFFTTKEPGKGTGLGLATVYGVVKQSGGFIWVESEPGSGTRFEIYLPRTEERVEGNFTEKTRKCTAPFGGRKSILVVEDEREVRELACGFLTSAGYNVFSAQDGSEALEIAERMGESIHAVLTDMVMPKMRGPELIARLKDLLPHIKVVYMTGYLEQNAGGDRFLKDALFLQKPFSRETVVNQVGRALNSERTERFEVETVAI